MGGGVGVKDNLTPYDGSVYGSLVSETLSGSETAMASHPGITRAQQRKQEEQERQGQTVAAILRVGWSNLRYLPTGEEWSVMPFAGEDGRGAWILSFEGDDRTAFQTRMSIAVTQYETSLIEDEDARLAAEKKAAKELAKQERTEEFATTVRDKERRNEAQDARLPWSARTSQKVTAPDHEERIWTIDKDKVLDEIVELDRELYNIEMTLRYMVGAAQITGQISWRDVGNALGCTRQNAQIRFKGVRKELLENASPEEIHGHMAAIGAKMKNVTYRLVDNESGEKVGPAYKKFSTANKACTPKQHIVKVYPEGVEVAAKIVGM